MSVNPGDKLGSCEILNFDLRLVKFFRFGGQKELQAMVEVFNLFNRVQKGRNFEEIFEPTALTHEAFLRLFGTRQVSWQNRAHFFAVAAQLMRRVLVEHARKRSATKRGGSVTRITFDEARTPTEAADLDILALHEALTQLEEIDPRQCRIVELRYFGGLDTEETAEVLGLSPSTVKRDWRVAKIWLRRALETPGRA